MKIPLPQGADGAPDSDVDSDSLSSAGRGGGEPRLRVPDAAGAARSAIEDLVAGDPRVADGRQSETARMIQRGVGRLLVGLGHAVVYELPLASGRRADVVALTPRGDLVIVEIKSSVEDYRTDRKWPDYRLHCDRLYFASHAGVPGEIFPPDAGLMLADGFGAAVLREAPEHRLAPATRKAVTLRFAQVAARRFHGLLDPGIQEIGAF